MHVFFLFYSHRGTTHKYVQSPDLNINKNYKQTKKTLRNIQCFLLMQKYANNSALETLIKLTGCGSQLHDLHTILLNPVMNGTFFVIVL